MANRSVARRFRSQLTPVVALCTAGALFLATVSGYAQQRQPAPAGAPQNPQPGVYVLPAQPAQPVQPVPPGQPVYTQQPADSPGYTAPIYQQTQPSYVPQSVALSGPKKITDWNEGDPIPPGYHPVERTRRGLVIGGAVMFGVLYLISILVAAGNADANSGGTNPAWALYIPAVGPFIQMGKTDGSTANVFLAIDGIAQSAGVAMFIYGIASPRTILIRNDLGQEKLKLRPTPMLLGRDGSGFGLVGSF